MFYAFGPRERVLMYIFLLMFPCSRQIQWTPPLRYDLFVWSFGESVPRIKFYPVTCRSWTKLLLVRSILTTFQPSVIRFLCYVLLRSHKLIDLSLLIFIHRHWNYSLSKNLYFDDPISRCVALFPSSWPVALVTSDTCCRILLRLCRTEFERAT